MEKLTNYGIVIVDKEGKVFSYVREIGHLHQEYLEKYSRLKGYTTSDRVEIAKGGDSVFYICDRKNILGFLPAELGEKQTEALETISNGLEELDLFAVRKFNENGYHDYNLKQNISQEFSNILSTNQENRKSK